MPKPSFSAAVRDKSIELASEDENLRSRGRIFTLPFTPVLGEDTEFWSECRLGGDIRAGKRWFASKVGVTGLCVVEAEVPRLCSLPWPADLRAAARAPWLGEDLIFASRGPVLALLGFGLVLYFQMLPSSPYIVDAG